MLTPQDITLAFVCHNRHNFLQQSLESVKDFPNKLILDNGTKNSQAKMLIKAYAQRYKAKLLHSEKNMGLMKAWNQCVESVETQQICLCPDDVIFRKNWLDDLNKVMKERPWTKIFFGNNYDCIIFNKEIYPDFFCFPEQYVQLPSGEDYHIHLEIAEKLGYSPYCWPGDHIRGQERINRLKVAKEASKNYMRKDNFTFWFTYEGFTPLCLEIPHVKDGASYASKDPNVKTGQQVFEESWQECSKEEPGALLNIDCLWYKRK